MIKQTTEKQEGGECLVVRHFMHAIQNDPRVAPCHVSLFAAIVYYKQTHGYGDKIYAFSYDLMPLAKISSVATYHKCIKNLHDFGYIDYDASFNRFTGSRITIK